MQNNIKVNHKSYKMLTHRQREGGVVKDTPPLSFLHVVTVAVFDEQLIKGKSLELDSP